MVKLEAQPCPPKEYSFPFRLKSWLDAGGEAQEREDSYKKPLGGLSVAWLYWRPPEPSELRVLVSSRGLEKLSMAPWGGGGERVAPMWASVGTCQDSCFLAQLLEVQKKLKAPGGS